MKTILTHLALKNPRFRCRADEHELVVKLRSHAGAPATARQLSSLEALAGNELRHLKPLYELANGLVFHRHRKTAGLIVARVNQLRAFAADWKESFFVGEHELHPFQRKGVAFATIAESGNYFVIYGGKVYYSDHDGGDDQVWGKSLSAFFERALGNPARFLYDAGCFTRYSDGKTKRQFIPEEFLHS
jgi:hypothetical protein